MAIHHLTPPFGGGERSRLPSAQRTEFSRRRENLHKMEAFGSGGPVTQAIRAMRAAEPTKVGHASPTFSSSTFTHGIRALSRTEVEDLIGGLIDLLDAMDGDTDREPNVGREPDLDREPDEQDACAAEWSGQGIHYFNVGDAA